MTKPTEFTLVMVDRDITGNIVRERTIISPSIEEAFKLSEVRRMPYDGHLVKDALRTETGVSLKTFCNLKIEVAFEDGTPEAEEFVRKGTLPVTCWKCSDRETSS